MPFKALVSAGLTCETRNGEVVEYVNLDHGASTSAFVEVKAAVDEAIAGNPDVVEKIKGGKMQAIGALMGPIMKATRGQADAGRVREIVLERLGVG